MVTRAAPEADSPTASGEKYSGSGWLCTSRDFARLYLAETGVGVRGVLRHRGAPSPWVASTSSLCGKRDLDTTSRINTLQGCGRDVACSSRLGTSEFRSRDVDAAAATAVGGIVRNHHARAFALRLGVGVASFSARIRRAARSRIRCASVFAAGVRVGVMRPPIRARREACPASRAVAGPRLARLRLGSGCRDGRRSSRASGT